MVVSRGRTINGHRTAREIHKPGSWAFPLGTPQETRSPHAQKRSELQYPIDCSLQFLGQGSIEVVRSETASLKTDSEGTRERTRPHTFLSCEVRTRIEHAPCAYSSMFFAVLYCTVRVSRKKDGLVRHHNITHHEKVMKRSVRGSSLAVATPILWVLPFDTPKSPLAFSCVVCYFATLRHVAPQASNTANVPEDTADVLVHTLRQVAPQASNTAKVCADTADVLVQQLQHENMKGARTPPVRGHEVLAFGTSTKISQGRRYLVLRPSLATSHQYSFGASAHWNATPWRSVDHHLRSSRGW